MIRIWRKISVVLVVLVLLCSSVGLAKNTVESGELKVESQKQGQEKEDSLKDIKVSEELIDGYWEKLNKRADELYGGLDINFKVLSGLYEDNEYKGEIKIEVPLYSKEAKRKKEKDKRSFLDKGAKLLKYLEVNYERLQILREKERILKTILLEEGVRSIDAYHDVREDIVEIEAEVMEVLRKLESMIVKN